ncbi:MAG: nicotinate phosphoribosyltransferase [Sulfolobales archaeon]
MYPSWDDVRKGKITDIYFKRTLAILRKYGLDRTLVRAEVHVYGLPREYKWAVFAGLEEALKLLEGRELDVYAIPEGTVFRELDPVMLIEGPVGEFVELETALLGILRHPTSVATKAARMKKLAGDKTLIFFGLRAAHPILAYVLDRAAYIGGCDAVSGAYSEELLGIKPLGTMPHLLILVFGDPRKAWRAFDETMDKEVPRIALVDTLFDERVETLLAVETLGEKLTGVRLDTPSSRRGNMRRIVEEVKWTLHMIGRDDVKVFVSGGLDERDIVNLRDVADGFGVGTSIAFPQSVDLSLDIVEIYRDNKWVPFSKRGKLPGAKKIYRCLFENKYLYYVSSWGDPVPKCPDGGEPENLLLKYMEKGKIIRELPKPNEIRKYVIEQLRYIDL